MFYCLQICMEPELGRIYDNDRPKFEALARRWTWKYAMLELQYHHRISLGLDMEYK